MRRRSGSTAPGPARSANSFRPHPPPNAQNHGIARTLPDRRPRANGYRRTLTLRIKHEGLVVVGRKSAAHSAGASLSAVRCRCDTDDVDVNKDGGMRCAFPPYPRLEEKKSLRCITSAARHGIGERAANYAS